MVCSSITNIREWNDTSRGKTLSSGLSAGQAPHKKRMCYELHDKKFIDSTIENSILNGTATHAVEQTSWIIPEPTTTESVVAAILQDQAPKKSMLHQADLPLEATHVPPSDFPTTKPEAKRPLLRYNQRKKFRVATEGGGELGI